MKPVKIEFTASVIGADNEDLVFIDSDIDSIENAIDIMKRNRFDCLPVKYSKNLYVTDYYYTIERNKWDKETVVRRTVSPDDSMNESADLEDIIDYFCENTDRYVWLINNGNVTKLVNLANVNSRPVRIWLYSLFCEFEELLSRFVHKHIKDEMMYKAFDEEQRLHYERDSEKGVENYIAEYLNFSQLLNIIRVKDLHTDIGYTTKTQFRKLFMLNDFRNQIMHPVRSMVSEDKNICYLNKKIKLLREAIELMHETVGDITF